MLSLKMLVWTKKITLSNILVPYRKKNVVQWDNIYIFGVKNGLNVFVCLFVLSKTFYYHIIYSECLHYIQEHSTLQ